jgi:hypothetical protein
MELEVGHGETEVIGTTVETAAVDFGHCAGSRRAS